MAHIWKHHVPLDMVPFSCSLCGFRCHNKKELVEHLTDYPRHREEAAKYGGKVDLAAVLHQAPKPYYVSERDMVLVKPDNLSLTSSLPSWLTEATSDPVQLSSPLLALQSAADVTRRQTVPIPAPTVTNQLPSWLAEETNTQMLSPLTTVPMSSMMNSSSMALQGQVSMPFVSFVSSNPLPQTPTALPASLMRAEPTFSTDIITTAAVLSEIREQPTATLFSPYGSSESSVLENPLPSQMPTPLQDERHIQSIMAEILPSYESDPLMLEACIPTKDTATQANIDDPEKKEMAVMVCKLLSELRKQTALMEQQNKSLHLITENVASLSSDTKRIERKVTAMERAQESKRENTVNNSAPVKRKKVLKSVENNTGK